MSYSWREGKKPSNDGWSATNINPVNSSESMTLAALMRQLETEPTAMSWLERRALVPRAMEGLRLGSEGAPAERLLVLLAQDSKWEVRKAVADQMLEATDALYEQLVLVLANDPNSFGLNRSRGRWDGVAYSTSRCLHPFCSALGSDSLRCRQERGMLVRKRWEKVRKQVAVCPDECAA